MIGGSNGLSPVNAVELLSFSEDSGWSWSLQTPMLRDRVSPSAVVFQGEVIVTGDGFAEVARLPRDIRNEALQWSFVDVYGYHPVRSIIVSLYSKIYLFGMSKSPQFVIIGKQNKPVKIADINSGTVSSHGYIHGGCTNMCCFVK